MYSQLQLCGASLEGRHLNSFFYFIGSNFSGTRMSVGWLCMWVRCLDFNLKKVYEIYESCTDETPWPQVAEVHVEGVWRGAVCCRCLYSLSCSVPAALTPNLFLPPSWVPPPHICTLPLWRWPPVRYYFVWIKSFSFMYLAFCIHSFVLLIFIQHIFSTHSALLRCGLFTGKAALERGFIC